MKIYHEDGTIDVSEEAAAAFDELEWATEPYSRVAWKVYVLCEDEIYRLKKEATK